ncbi:SGNH/GDSL hydrolase family protein, partial [bacterium]|nr:SGNH/GDSL hydrolase family protein [candidate division CSSED10-310 bacterium]
MKHRARKALGYLLYLILVLTGMNFLVYLRYVRSLPPNMYPTKFKLLHHIDAALASRIGPLSWDIRSSFTRFPLEKPEGILRIGCFGDSFTYGYEVSGGNDFPSLLQGRLDATAAESTEVLNFGVPGYGFHEAYILWEALADRFQLDYVLLGPECFQWRRDMTYHGPDLGCPQHARYVMDGSDLRLSMPVGDSPWEREKAWRRFIPHWRYLRYDWMTPVFLQALLPAGREFPVNPFYYHSDPRAEALTTYKLLLQRMAQASREVVMIHKDAVIAATAASINAPNLAVGHYQMELIERFPYEMVGGHYSPIGNDVVARLFQHTLLGNSPSTIRMVVGTHSIHPDEVPASRRLDEYGVVEVVCNGIAFGRFGTPSGHAVPDEEMTGLPKGTASLLSIHLEDASVCDCAFIPSPVRLTKDMTCEVHIQLPTESVSIELGKVRMIAPGIGEVIMSRDLFHHDQIMLHFEAFTALKPSLATAQPVSDCCVFMDGTILTRVERRTESQNIDSDAAYSNTFVLQPASGSLLRLCALSDGFLDLTGDEQEHMVDIRYTTPEGQSITAPFARIVMG